MCDMRVKLTYTFSAAGTTAPIFISILGLTERELPQDLCISLKIKGLCVDGGGLTAESSQEGMILLIRGDVDYDKVRYTIYRDQFFLPFVAKTKSEYGGWQDGTPIPDNLQGVSWKDGEYAQIAIDTTEKCSKLYSENLICANTQNVSRSGTEKAADLTKRFKL